MSERPELFTLEFWQATITQAVHGMAAGGIGPLVAHQANLIGDVPWYGIMSSMAAGALISFLGSLTTLRIPGRVPGSFLKETTEEARVERMVLREEAIALERKRIRNAIEDKNFGDYMDRHRADEPREYGLSGEMHSVEGENATWTDPFEANQNCSVTDTEGNKVAEFNNESRPVPMQDVPRREPPETYAPQRISQEPEISGLPTWAQTERDLDIYPEVPEPQHNSEEDWPQGGKRGKHSQGKE